MILVAANSASCDSSIPRESGDDPIKADELPHKSWYSPRERG